MVINFDSFILATDKFNYGRADIFLKVLQVTSYCLMASFHFIFCNTKKLCQRQHHMHGMVAVFGGTQNRRVRSVRGPRRRSELNGSIVGGVKLLHSHNALLASWGWPVSGGADSEKFGQKPWNRQRVRAGWKFLRDWDTHT